ncbi:hypothetical protein ACFQ3Z_07200 [Streptomyces nogalater]
MRITTFAGGPPHASRSRSSRAPTASRWAEPFSSASTAFSWCGRTTASRPGERSAMDAMPLRRPVSPFRSISVKLTRHPVRTRTPHSCDSASDMASSPSPQWTASVWASSITRSS